jgi:hypothetical protein
MNIGNKIIQIFDDAESLGLKNLMFSIRCNSAKRYKPKKKTSAIEGYGSSPKNAS